MKAKAVRLSGNRIPVKYRDAATGSTWSGRGLQPKWLKVALERGKTLAEFAVPLATATPGATLSDTAAWPFAQGEGVPT